MTSGFTTFKWPLIFNVAALIGTFLIWGWSATLIVLILTVLEVTFSFDNAVVNAKTLKKMDAKWQKLFLTVGVLIAVFGMRLVFPLVVVAIAAGINPIEALKLGINNPHAYSDHLHHAHGAIAAFGGTFLLLLFLDWLANEKEHNWLRIERWFEGFGWVGVGALGTVLVIGIAGDTVLLPAFLGALTYFAVSNLDKVLDKIKLSAGLGAFLYLEVLDASFSFDGVIGAFAITSDIFLIAIGLGIGAAYVRSLTVYLTHKGTLSEYRYLEHGAHWAIGVLSIMLLLSIKVEIPDAITGIIGVMVIASAFYQSIKINKKEGKNNERVVKSHH